MRDVAIKFRVDPSHTDEVTVDYLPFGTRVLKIKVVNTAGPTDVPLILRPANTPSRHENAGWFAAHADNRSDIWVTWGGGHELGPCAHGRDIGWQERCAPLGRNASSHAYLYVTHRPESPTASLSDATLTLLAVAGSGASARGLGGEACLNCKERAEAATPVGSLRINLRVPYAGAIADPFRPLWATGEDRIVFRGSQIPTYLSRWWPDPCIQYHSAVLPDLSIHYQPLSAPATWPWPRLWRAVGAALIGEPGRLEVRLGGDPIMTIAGTIEPALFRGRWVLPEVYRFYSPHYLVLRLWFFWLDTGLDVLRHRMHEIPDIERFDVLIDLEEGKALYAGTDLHWREMWGAVQAQPIKSHIGLSAGKLFRLLGQRLEDEFFELLAIWDKTQGVARNPAVHLCKELTGHAHCDHRVTAAEDEIIVRGAGLYATHSPYFDDETVKLDGRLTSGDVRRS